MRVQAEPGDIFVKFQGVECRVWNAVNEKGEQLFMFVPLIATREDFSAGYEDLFAEVHGVRLETTSRP